MKSPGKFQKKLKKKLKKKPRKPSVPYDTRYHPTHFEMTATAAYFVYTAATQEDMDAALRMVDTLTRLYGKDIDLKEAAKAASEAAYFHIRALYLTNPQEAFAIAALQQNLRHSPPAAQDLLS